MQYTLIDLLDSDHVLVGLEAEDAHAAILALTAALVKTNHVTSEFAEDVWQREQTFPTGLPTQPLAVAIPHADPDHVNQSAVCLGILKSPVSFAQMGADSSTVLEVYLIFLLAIKEREKQVEMIQQLIQLIQTGSLLEQLAVAKDSAQAYTLIHQTFA